MDIVKTILLLLPGLLTYNALRDNEIIKTRSQHEYMALAKSLLVNLIALALFIPILIGLGYEIQTINTLLDAMDNLSLIILFTSYAIVFRLISVPLMKWWLFKVWPSAQIKTSKRNKNYIDVGYLNAWQYTLHEMILRNKRTLVEIEMEGCRKSYGEVGIATLDDGNLTLALKYCDVIKDILLHRKESPSRIEAIPFLGEYIDTTNKTIIRLYNGSNLEDT